MNKKKKASSDNLHCVIAELTKLGGVELGLYIPKTPEHTRGRQWRRYKREEHKMVNMVCEILLRHSPHQG